MKINTDLVKGKKYSSAVKPNTLKHSQEYRVLATLRYLYSSKFDTMITGEAPDLQDSASSTGIEVTAAVKEDDMKVSRAFSELNQGKPKDIEKRKNIIKSSGYFSVPLKDEKVAISTSGTADGEKRFFQESIRRKTKKFSSTDQILRGWDLPYFCPKFQPLMQKITYLSGLPNCLTSLQTCLILCMLFLIVSVCIMIRKRKLPKSVHSPKMKVCYSLRLAE